MMQLIELVLLAAALGALGLLAVRPEYRLHPWSDLVVWVSGITLLIVIGAFILHKETAASAPQPPEAVMIQGTASSFLYKLRKE